MTDPLQPALSSATFFTITDARFAPATAAMLNSLRLQGHDEPVVILDVGLDERGRRGLERAATLIKFDRGLASNPTLFKAFPRLARPSGVVVIIDSDQIVTHSLDGVVEAAAEGAICAVPDPEVNRWFTEWSHLFELRAELRRQPYVNAGFIAFSVDHWPELLDRWWTACERIWNVPTIYERNDGDDAPAAQGDQDALNAILMSEVPLGSVRLLDPSLAPAADAIAEGVEIVKLDPPRCRYRGTETLMLHSAGRAKPWIASDWPYVRRTAYVRLLRRLLTGDDIAVRLPSRSLPPWLRRGLAGATSMVLLNGVLAIAWRLGNIPLVRPLARRVRIALT